MQVHGDIVMPLLGVHLQLVNRGLSASRGSGRGNEAEHSPLRDAAPSTERLVQSGRHVNFGPRGPARRVGGSHGAAQGPGVDCFNPYCLYRALADEILEIPEVRPFVASTPVLPLPDIPDIGVPKTSDSVPDPTIQYKFSFWYQYYHEEVCHQTTAQ
eukprot:1191427-Rhodomonas_salina.1